MVTDDLDDLIAQQTTELRRSRYRDVLYPQVIQPTKKLRVDLRKAPPKQARKAIAVFLDDIGKSHRYIATVLRMGQNTLKKWIHPVDDGKSA